MRARRYDDTNHDSTTMAAAKLNKCGSVLHT
jgi:hypothetical protein